MLLWLGAPTSVPPSLGSLPQEYKETGALKCFHGDACTVGFQQPISGPQNLVFPHPSGV